VTGVPDDEPAESLSRIRAAIGELAPVHEHAIARSSEMLRGEFRGRYSPETIDRMLFDSVDRLLLTGKNPSSVAILAERFARQRLESASAPPAAHPSAVLFVCRHNSARSQIAAAWCRRHSGARLTAYTAGTEPVTSIEPVVVEALAELGLDVTEEFPKPLTVEILEATDVVVTMGCGDACPVFPGKRYEDWKLDDPAGLPIEAVRPIRDEIGRRVRALLTDLGIERSR
jgi:protein-tyrosine-phosphatase